MSCIVVTMVRCDDDSFCPKTFTERGHHSWSYMAMKLPTGWTTQRRKPKEVHGSPIKFLCPKHSLVLPKDGG